MRYQLLLFTTLFLFFSSPAPCFWSHGPIGDQTRLNHHKDRVWILTLIINDEVVYPAALYVPAGFEINLDVINLSSKDIHIESKRPVFNYLIKKNDSKSCSFGPLPIGDHPFIIHMPLSEEETHDPYMVPGRMACKIIAKQWPGIEHVYRTSLICRGKELSPKELWLPAGKISELFVIGDRHAAHLVLKAGSQSIVIKPNEVTMTEFINPKGGQYDLIIDGKAKSKLTIR